MKRPLIAVIGDASKCRDPALVRRAAVELGRELAEQNCRILVFSSSKEFIEWEIVQGYIEGRTVPPASIEVHYPPTLDSRFPGESHSDPRFKRNQQGTDWEASIYPAFASIDGIVLIGGGRTTRIAGLLAIGSRTPMITLAGLGGEAETVWHDLQRYSARDVTVDELNLMMEQTWHDESAARLVNALLLQRQRKLDKQQTEALALSELARRRKLTLLAVLGTGLFVLLLLALVEWQAPQVPRSLLWLVFLAPAVGGAASAAIRLGWDESQRHRTVDTRPIIWTLALGFFVSGSVGVLFLLPQFSILGPIKKEDLFKFAAIAVSMGLIAGLTVDKVFRRLIKEEVPLDPFVASR